MAAPLAAAALLIPLVGNAVAADYRNEKYGFSLTVPEQFEAGTPRNPDDGGLWISRDGSARLIAVAAPNTTKETLASYRSFLMEESYKSAKFDYTPMREDWFVLSGRMDDEMFYERITFACDGRYIYGWQMKYPVSERRRYDAMAELIHRSYQVGRGRDGNCG